MPVHLSLSCTYPHTFHPYPICIYKFLWPECLPHPRIHLLNPQSPVLCYLEVGPFQDIQVMGVEPVVVVCMWVAKEFTDMKQNERGIKFLKVGDALEFQAGSRESRTLLQASSHFVASRQRRFLLEWWHYVFGQHAIGEGNGNPLQYSCLENPTDRGAWWATVHGVTKSQTRLSTQQQDAIGWVIG